MIIGNLSYMQLELTHTGSGLGCSNPPRPSPSEFEGGSESRGGAGLGTYARAQHTKTERIQIEMEWLGSPCGAGPPHRLAIIWPHDGQCVPQLVVVVLLLFRLYICWYVCLLVCRRPRAVFPMHPPPEDKPL